jgi:dolichol-phosphate mannosyltransferase
LARFSVIAPTYNEAGNVEPLVTRILGALGPQSEVVVVDDDSPDGTWKLAEGLAKVDKRVRVIRRIGRRGLTTAISEGIAAAKGGMIAWMDADLSMPPEKLPELFKALEHADVAVGSRYIGGGEDARRMAMAVMLSTIINKCGSLILGTKATDLTSGFIAAKKEVLKAIPLRGDYGEYCIDFLVRAERKGYRLVEIPYSLVKRERGESKTATNFLGFAKRGRKYLTTVLKLRLEKRG